MEIRKNSMNIQVDSREHESEWKRISKQFDELEVKYFRSKLYVGDYQSMDNTRLVVDRKKDLQELYGNICAQHERFKRELLKAMEQGIKIVILCEHGEDVKSLEDVYFFYQAPTKRWRVVKRDINGKEVKVRESYIQKEINGKSMYKSFCTIRDRYNVDFVFCNKDETGRKIVEILGGSHE